jgi:hypothetical protein
MPDAGQQTATIKAFPDEDVAALFRGDAMGLAKEAGLNGVSRPGIRAPAGFAARIFCGPDATSLGDLQSHKRRRRTAWL